MLLSKESPATSIGFKWGVAPGLGFRGGRVELAGEVVDLAAESFCLRALMSQ